MSAQIEVDADEAGASATSGVNGSSPQGRGRALIQAHRGDSPSRAVSRLRRAAPAVLLAGSDLTALGFALALASGDRGLSDVGWVALTLALLAVRGAYRTRLTFSLLSDMPVLAGRCIAAGALIVALARPSWSDTPAGDIRHILVATGFLLAGRGMAYTVIRYMRRHRIVEHRTLIIGAGVVGAQIARTAVEHPEFGLRPVGFLDERPLLPDHELSVPVIGGTRDIGDVIREREIEHVIVAFTQDRESSAVDLIRTCDRLDCEIFFVPRLFELSAIHGTMEELLGLPLVRLRRATFRTFAWKLKRLFDIVVATLALTIFLLPMLVIAAVLRIAHGPGVIFRQERIGLDGRAFQLAKFRSLPLASSTEGDTRWSIEDQRLDRLGRFLRKWSLDELPQLINILRGEMSLVGPRPERTHFVEQFADALPRYVARHRVPCGLTGWAQIHGLRGDTSIEERVRFDNHYIENWSLWLDVKILLRTLLAFRKGT